MLHSCVKFNDLFFIFYFCSFLFFVSKLWKVRFLSFLSFEIRLSPLLFCRKLRCLHLWMGKIPMLETFLCLPPPNISPISSSPSPHHMLLTPSLLFPIYPLLSPLLPQLPLPHLHFSMPFSGISHGELLIMMMIWEGGSILGYVGVIRQVNEESLRCSF